MASASFKQKLNAVEQDSRHLVLAEINHSGLTSPVRIVNDTEDVVHLTNTYTALSFGITLPSQEEGGSLKASIEIDNIGRELMQWLEVSDGAKGATVTLSIILRENPDVAEIGPFTLDMTNVKVSPYTVRANLGYDDLLNRPLCQVQYRPANKPGLF